jgi:predicted metal-dependent phosphoesterase TrpH
VLGLNIDPAAAPLCKQLASQEERRRQRMRKICARLTQLSLPGGELLAAVEAAPGLPTRSHLAAALWAGGHVSGTEEAFRKYLRRGKAAHIAADWPPLDEVVAWITAAGGVAVLAHPARYALSAGGRRRLLADFVAAGVRFGLKGSVGSDFHSPQQIWNPLGRSLKLPDCVVPVWRSFGL